MCPFGLGQIQTFLPGRGNNQRLDPGQRTRVWPQLREPESRYLKPRPGTGSVGYRAWRRCCVPVACRHRRWSSRFASSAAALSLRAATRTRRCKHRPAGFDAARRAGQQHWVGLACLPIARLTGIGSSVLFAAHPRRSQNSRGLGPRACLPPVVPRAPGRARCAARSCSPFRPASTCSCRWRVR